MKTDILTIFSPEKRVLMNTNLLISLFKMSHNVISQLSDILTENSRLHAKVINDVCKQKSTNLTVKLFTHLHYSPLSDSIYVLITNHDLKHTNN